MKPHYNSRKNKYLLFTPGPVNVAKNVRSAIGKEVICHRESDFDNLLLSVENKVLKLFEIKNVNNYRAVFITGSGTAANEAVLSSVVVGCLALKFWVIRPALQRQGALNFGFKSFVFKVLKKN